GCRFTTAVIELAIDFERHAGQAFRDCRNASSGNGMAARLFDVGAAYPSRAQELAQKWIARGDARFLLLEGPPVHRAASISRSAIRRSAAVRSLRERAETDVPLYAGKLCTT